MIPSPMNLSRVPSYLKIVSTIGSKYSLSISTMASAFVPSLIAVKPRMSLLKIVSSWMSWPPFFTSSLPLIICSATFGATRRMNRSRTMISFSIFFVSIVFSMNIAAWLATEARTSRSFGWNCASDSESSHRTPSTSFSLSWTSGTTIALEIRFRIIDLPLDAAKSIDASWVSTPARSLMT